MRTQIIDPARLDPFTRAQLVREVYALHCEIFEGPCLAAFEAQVFRGGRARRTRLLIGRDRGRAVAYSAVHIHNRAGQPYMRAEAGALPAYRGRLFMRRLWVSEVARALAVYGRPLTYVGTFVHSSAYTALWRVMDVRPTIARAIPDGELERVVAACGLDVEGLPRGLARVGWVTRDEPRASAMADWFERQNPRFREGVGLIVVTRFTPWTLARATLAASIRYMSRRS